MRELTFYLFAFLFLPTPLMLKLINIVNFFRKLRVKWSFSLLQKKKQTVCIQHLIKTCIIKKKQPQRLALDLLSVQKDVNALVIEKGEEGNILCQSGDVEQ